MTVMASELHLPELPEGYFWRIKAERSDFNGGYNRAVAQIRRRWFWRISWALIEATDCDLTSAPKSATDLAQNAVRYAYGVWEKDRLAVHEELKALAGDY